MPVSRSVCAPHPIPVIINIDIDIDIYIEIRYHGHSMSDPGTTYRNRDEIASMRTARDPIEFVKNLLVDNSLAEAQELKDIEKDIRKEVQVG